MGFIRIKMNQILQTECVETICNLINSGIYELRSEAFPNAEVIEFLHKHNIIQYDGIVDEIICHYCDELHLAEVSLCPFEGVTQIYCPDHGFIKVDNNTVNKFKLDMICFLKQLCYGRTQLHSNNFNIAPGFLWRLGRYEYGKYRIELLLVSRIAGASDLSRIQRILTTIPKPDIGLIFIPDDSIDITTINELYHLLPLNQFLSFDQKQDSFSINENELDYQVKSLVPQIKYKKPGPVSGKQATVFILRELKNEGTLKDGRNERARQIVEHWKDYFPEQNVPAQTTVEGHLTQLSKEEENF